MTTNNLTQTQTTEYWVTLETIETDERGAPFERRVAVSFDGEVDWDNWLAYFNHLECEEYRIVSVTESTDVGDEF